MLKNIFSLILIFSFTATMAQKSVESKQLEDHNGIIFLKGEKTPFTGTAVALFPTGKKQIESPYLNGKETGVETTWFPDGKKMMEITVS